MNRFEPAVPGAAEPPDPVSPEERQADLRADIADIGAQCNALVDRGRDGFFDPGDPRSRLAAKALLIDLATACGELDSFTQTHPELWRAIERTRDKMAHHYRDTNYVRVWETLSTDVPQLLELIVGE